MAIEKSIRNYLLDQSAVTALIGSRYWPNAVEQTWLPTQGPCLIYQFISSDEEHSVLSRTGFVSSRLQFTSFAGSSLAANATIRAVKNSGITAIKGMYSGTFVNGVNIVSGIQTYIEKPDDGKAAFRYLAEIDLMVHYLED